jgi:hypothetical protein
MIAKWFKSVQSIKRNRLLKSILSQHRNNENLIGIIYYDHINTIVRKPISNYQISFVAAFEYLKRRKNEKINLRQDDIIYKNFFDDKYFLLAIIFFSELPLEEYSFDIIKDIIKIKAESKEISKDLNNLLRDLEIDRQFRNKLREKEDYLIQSQLTLSSSDFNYILKEIDQLEEKCWKSKVILELRIVEDFKLIIS